MTVEPESSPLSANGDRDELFQVFHNLIENAVKYGRDDGTVKVHLTGNKGADRAGKSGDTVTITVADDGPGIAPEHLPRLTERFYRVSAEHSRRIGGTGLGSRDRQTCPQSARGRVIGRNQSLVTARLSKSFFRFLNNIIFSIYLDCHKSIASRA